MLRVCLQMADPLTALMYAVQVINFLKTLIEKTLREREDSVIDPTSVPHMESSDDNGNENCSGLHHRSRGKSNEETIHEFVVEDPASGTDWEETSRVENITDDEDYHSYSTCSDESEESVSCAQNQVKEKIRSQEDGSSDSNRTKPQSKSDSGTKIEGKGKGSSNLSRINSMTEWFEAWR